MTASDSWMLKRPSIIQGGMGVAVSNWVLARAVSRLGHLGVVSGTALDIILSRRLQDGDLSGHMRHALEHFPFQKMAKRILDAFYIPGGKAPDAPYRMVGTHQVEGSRFPQEMCIAGNFVEVFLAREGHGNAVGINYLEKVQLPHLPSIYGAMLAGVSVILMGAGIPLAVPAIIKALTMHGEVSYPINITNAAPEERCVTTFAPADFMEDILDPAPLSRPLFFPIIASDALASIMCQRATGPVDGFIVEGPLAGGHNAPPRGKLVLTQNGQPVYGPRDVVSVEALRKLGLPFWLAGFYGAPERVQEALSQGACGVQVGTAFALCRESGLAPALKRQLLQKALKGNAKVFTDPLASPTGFPFKVVELEGTLSESDVYHARRRLCDLGFLREPYRREDGSMGYRCPAEPESAFVAKGGDLADTVRCKCICNALISNVSMAQRLQDGTTELPVVTLGDDYANIGRFCAGGNLDYTAADVIRVLGG